MEAESFAQCISRLIEQGDTSIAGLARSLEVDRSTIYKWMRGERVPDRNTTHMERIRQVLKLNEADFKALEAAWRRSVEGLRQRAPIPRARHSLAANQLPAHRLVARASGVITMPVARHVPKQGTIPSSASRRDVIEAALSLLHKLGMSFPEEGHREIYITFQGRENFLNSDDLAQTWQRALFTAINNGWSVNVLLRLDRSAQRTIGLIEEMLALLGPGNPPRIGTYSPRYLKPLGLAAPPLDLIVVPEMAVMLLLATTQDTRPDAMIYIEDKEQVRTFHRYVERLADQAFPLLNSYSDNLVDIIAFERKVAESGKYGEHLLVEETLATLLQPPEWHQKGTPWAEAIQKVLLEAGLGEEYLSEVIDLRRFRLDDFARRRYPFRAICPRWVIRDIVEKGIYARAELGRKQATFQLDANEEGTTERERFLSNLIDFLNKYPNFQLALIDDAQAEALVSRNFWLVAGTEKVLMETWRSDIEREDPELRIEVLESTIVNGFVDAFQDNWSRIAPEQKRRDDVIEWLKQQRKSLGS